MAVAHRSFGVIVAGAGPVDVVDVVETAHGLRAVIGTVEAADTAARPVAAALVTAFRSCADEAAVEDVAAALDAAVSGMGGEAVSAAVLVVGVGAQGDATVVNCGHPEPLLLFAGGGAIPLRTTRGTAPLGRRPRPARDDYHLQRGEAVLCFTAGVTQARGGKGPVFDLVTRCRGAVGETLDATAVVDCVFADLFVHFGGAVGHDASLLLLHRLR
jgi:serine phosphatase RsbU (regulator of sigma subunit)